MTSILIAKIDLLRSDLNNDDALRSSYELELAKHLLAKNIDDLMRNAICDLSTSLLSLSWSEL